MVTSTALSAGARVSLRLTGEAAWFALPEKAEEPSLPYAAPLPDLLDAVLAGVSVTVCTQCAARPSMGGERRTRRDLRAGSPSFVEEALADDVQTLVY